MKLWVTYHRRPLQKGDRKVRVFRYVVMAETRAAAIDLAREEESHLKETGKFTATEIPGAPVFNIGLYFDEPGPEDK